ncbi:MAG TPA: ATP-binding protein [Spirochaetota bacterium]|nr:ATP-binding protein [Spirochaetota bacterium]HPC40316.1 ATP-binding protein [Spirochaetota bacterium]HPL18259.1 ATP-binding protein [Spirochaetota bacterium]HQF07210.1 ATP-binding protein [Spirochaetota bacterium]HQH96110.1 ATP-binding protein [Spirochaetota bacterium]
MFKRISNRIIISFMILIATLVAVLLLLIIDEIRDYHHSILKREMAEKISFIELEIRNQPQRYLAGTADLREKRIRELSAIINLRITLVDFNGKVIADSEYENIDGMDNHRYRVEIKDAINRGTGESIRYSSTLRTDMLYMAKKFDAEIIRLAKPLREVDENIALLRGYILMAGGIALALSLLIVILVTRRITRPINETVRFARDFSNGEFSRRISNYSDDEIGTLQKALNRLADTVVEKINSLLFEQNKLEITIESIHDGIAVVGRDKTILIANRAFKSLLGIESEVVGKLFFEAIRNRSLNSRIEQTHGTNIAMSFEETFLSGRHCDVFINPIAGDENPGGILIVLHDTTEKKKVEQMKTDLVSNMSHELKTPIAILKGYLETMEPHLADPVMSKELLQKALANVDRQSSLINDILKLNRIETSREFTTEYIDVREIIGTSIDILGPKAQKKNVAITFNTDGQNARIAGNRFLAEEIFFNIIDNAINYNVEGGSITVDMEKSGGGVTVAIVDTGIGIPEESLDRVFERFYRVDKSRSRATGGTGLGLSIVKHAAEILGWSINVTSSSSGTKFIIGI